MRGPWAGDFIEGACRFPQGKHDDQIDAVSLAVQMMTARKRRGWSFWLLLVTFASTTLAFTFPDY